MLVYDRRRYVGILLSQILIGEPIVSNNSNNNSPAVTAPPKISDVVPDNDVSFHPMSLSSSLSLSSSATTTILEEIQEIAEFIVSNTPKEYRVAVRNSGGKFLYRGDDYDTIDTDATSKVHRRNRRIDGRIDNPNPDLLEIETYGNDTAAVRYFQRLEQRLLLLNINNTITNMFVAKPSNGHIATSDPNEANKWGNVVSVWPLLGSTNSSVTSSTSDEQGGGTSLFSYVWLKNRSTFYPNNNNNNNNDNNGNGNDDNDHDVLVINERLDDALKMKSGREVLFVTTTETVIVTTKKNHNPSRLNKRKRTTTLPSSPFLVVPIELDYELRKQLELLRYGL